jgi:hypothetical protein
VQSSTPSSLRDRGEQSVGTRSVYRGRSHQPCRYRRLPSAKPPWPQSSVRARRQGADSKRGSPAPAPSQSSRIQGNIINNAQASVWPSPHFQVHQSHRSHFQRHRLPYRCIAAIPPVGDRDRGDERRPCSRKRSGISLTTCVRPQSAKCVQRRQEGRAEQQHCSIVS